MVDFALKVIQPELVAPMVVSLPSRACEFSHHNFSACAGRFARVFVGLGEGWLAEPGSKPTVEDSAAHLCEVSATEPFTVPGSIFEEVFEVCRRWASQRRRSADVGAVIMLGTLFGLIALIFGVVLYFDPEARRTPSQERDR